MNKLISVIFVRLHVIYVGYWPMVEALFLDLSFLLQWLNKHMHNVMCDLCCVLSVVNHVHLLRDAIWEWS